MTRTRLLGFLRLFRFELPFAAGVCVVLGQFLALDSIPPLQEIVLGFLSVFFISATALILNDYFDLEIDRINAPHRPLPSGMVSKRDVLVLSFVVAFLGLMAAALLSLTALITILVVWIVGVLYNWRFKRSGLAGNLMVSFSVGMTFVFGGISVGQPGKHQCMVVRRNRFSHGPRRGDRRGRHGHRRRQDHRVPLPGNRLWSGTRTENQRRGIWRSDPGQPGAICSGQITSIYLIPIMIMDIVILYSTVRLLNPATRNPRAHIRAIYLGGLAAVLLFIGLRVIGGWAVAA